MFAHRNARRARVRILGIITLAGGTVFSSCTVADVRHNLVAGTMSFIEDYTADVWGALLPPPEALVGSDEE